MRPDFGRCHGRRRCPRGAPAEAGGGARPGVAAAAASLPRRARSRPSSAHPAPCGSGSPSTGRTRPSPGRWLRRARRPRRWRSSRPGSGAEPLRCESSSSGSASVRWTSMSPFSTWRPFRKRPALNGLTSRKTCDGWGRQDPRPSRRELARISRLRRDPCSLPLPIVLCRGGNSISVVALAHEECVLQLCERRLDFCEPRVTVDARLERRRRCSPPCGGCSGRTGAGRSPAQPAGRADARPRPRSVDLAADLAEGCCLRRDRRSGRCRASVPTCLIARSTSGWIRSCCANLMIVRFAPPTCLLAPLRCAGPRRR